MEVDYPIQVYFVALEDMEYILVWNHSNYISLLTSSLLFETDLKSILFSQNYFSGICSLIV